MTLDNTEFGAVKVFAILFACASLWYASDLVVIALIGSGDENLLRAYHTCALKSSFFLLLGVLCWKRDRLFLYLALYFVALSGAMWVVFGYWASPFLSKTDLSRLSPKYQEFYASVEPNWAMPVSMIAISIIIGFVLFKIDGHEKSRMQSNVQDATDLD